MSAPLDLIVVLRKLGACRESIAWLRKRRRQDPGASFAKRWDEVASVPGQCGFRGCTGCRGLWRAWALQVSNQCDLDERSVQRGLHARFMNVATPAEVEAARMVRR